MTAVHVVGGGPAGLGLGIALRDRGVPVTVSEASSYPRHRVCGEVLHGLSAATIRDCGLAEVLEEARPLRSTAWFCGGREVLRGELPSPGWGVSRLRLDAALAQRFRSMGGDLREGVRVGAGSEPAEGPGVVWCSGRRAETDSAWIGLKAHFRGVPLRADVEMHLGEGGYVGLNGVEGGWVNVCGLFQRKNGVQAGRDALLLRYLEEGGWEELVRMLRDAELREGSAAGVSAFQLGPVRNLERDGNCLRLGDRRAIIGPFTGSGMAMALESAACCAPRLTEYSTGRLEWPDAVRSCEREMHRRFRIRMAFAGLAHPFLAAWGSSRRVPPLGAAGGLAFRFIYGLMFRGEGGKRDYDYGRI